MIHLFCYNYSMREIKLTNIFKRIIHSYQTIIKNCLDLLFPRRCFGCQKEKTRLCQTCLSNLPRSFCSGEEKIFSVFDYNSPIIKQAIWALKYKRAIDLTETFARAMSDTLFEELADGLVLSPRNSPSSFSPSNLKEDQGLAGEAKIILIPVPLSRARYHQRGYNQAEELAKQMVKLNPEQFALETSLVKKIKDTPTQVSLRDRAKRLANLKGAFEVRPWPTGFKVGLQGARKSNFETANGQVIVIIDDVSTTGATINEIRQLLQKAGPAGGGVNHHRIYGLVLAHG